MDINHLSRGIIMKKTIRRSVAGLAIAGIALTACGQSSTPKATDPDAGDATVSEVTITNDETGETSTYNNIPTVSEREVADHIAKEIGGEVETTSSYLEVWSPSGDCGAILILTSEAAVAMYADAGDPVVTDSTGTVGVKISGTDMPKCAADMGDALATLDVGE